MLRRRQTRPDDRRRLGSDGPPRRHRLRARRSLPRRLPVRPDPSRCLSGRENPGPGKSRPSPPDARRPRIRAPGRPRRVRPGVPLPGAAHPGRKLVLSHFPYSRDRGLDRYTEYRMPDCGMPVVHGHTHSKRRATRSVDGSRQIHVGFDARAPWCPRRTCSTGGSGRSGKGLDRTYRGPDGGLLLLFAPTTTCTVCTVGR